MTREERDRLDGILTPRIRARIAEEYQTAAVSYCRKWEKLQHRQAKARHYVRVPGLGERFRASALPRCRLHGDGRGRTGHGRGVDGASRPASGSLSARGAGGDPCPTGGGWLTYEIGERQGSGVMARLLPKTHGSP